MSAPAMLLLTALGAILAVGVGRYSGSAVLAGAAALTPFALAGAYVRRHDG